MTYFSIRTQIQKFIIWLLYGIVQGFLFLANAFAITTGWLARHAWNIAKLILRNPLIFLYKRYLKLQARLTSLGIEIRNPFVFILSSKSLNHLLLVGLVAIILIANIQSKSSDVDFFLPHNILSHTIKSDEDSGTDETIATLPESQYNPIEGLKSQQESEGFEPTTPGDIALTPGALIKPTLPTTSQRSDTPNAVVQYAVKDGDTLSSIAHQFGLKIATLLWANNLSDRTTLKIGQRLNVPPIDGVIHRIHRGDTLERIASSYKADPDKILAFNNLSSPDNLVIGKTIIVPEGTIEAPDVIPPKQAKTLLGKLKNILLPEKGVRPPRSIPVQISGVFRMIWPTSANRITQYFSWHHTGIDIAGPISNQIFAAADGVVVIAGWQNGYGNTVLIDHGNGTRTRYGHASRLYVGVGERVKRGETIAMVGSTGHSTGPHLHFEVLKANKRVNPLSYIR